MPNIKLKDKNGNDVTKQGIETVTFDTDVEEVQATFSYGIVEEKTLALDMASGNQEITADMGKLLSKIIIEKPSDLVAENIKANVTIGGVEGNFVGNSQEKTVDLAMADGNQEVVADEGFLLSKVTVNKPETLLPENIALGVDIGGVIGTFQGGGMTEEELKHFAYTIYPDNSSILIRNALYSDIYTYTGSYNVVVPDKLGAYDTVLTNGTSTIGVFSNNSSVKNITIGENVRSQGNMSGMFYNCQALNSQINIPKDATNMTQTFYNCRAFNKPITMPNSVINITNAFRECRVLNSTVVLSENLKYMGCAFLTDF